MYGFFGLIEDKVYQMWLSKILLGDTISKFHYTCELKHYCEFTDYEDYSWYCSGNHLRCARYIAMRILGFDDNRIPRDLTPEDFERIHEILIKDCGCNS